MRGIDVSFDAMLERIPTKGGWTYIAMDWTPEYFGTRGSVKRRGTIDGHPFHTSLMPLGDGRHMLPVHTEIRTAIGKQAGDLVTVAFMERIDLEPSARMLR